MDRANSIPKNAQGRFYHIDCAPGDLDPYIFTCGDPDRAKRISRFFDRVELRRRNRELLIYTGAYKNFPVSVMATGIGAPPIAIQAPRRKPPHPGRPPGPGNPGQPGRA
jgi:uridine phosphorylase